MSDLPHAIGHMQQRVQCTRCQAHRDLTLAARCFVCGGYTYTCVEPTAGDRQVEAPPEQRTGT